MIQADGTATVKGLDVVRERIAKRAAKELQVFSERFLAR